MHRFPLGVLAHAMVTAHMGRINLCFPFYLEPKFGRKALRQKSILYLVFRQPIHSPAAGNHHYGQMSWRKISELIPKSWSKQ